MLKNFIKRIRKNSNFLTFLPKTNQISAVNLLRRSMRTRKASLKFKFQKEIFSDDLAIGEHQT